MDFLEEVTTKLHSQREALARQRGKAFHSVGATGAKERGEKARHKEESLWEALSPLCFIIALAASGVLAAGNTVSNCCRKQSS